MCLGKCISYFRSLSKHTLKLFFGWVSLLTSRDSEIVDAILLKKLLVFCYSFFISMLSKLKKLLVFISLILSILFLEQFYALSHCLSLHNLYSLFSIFLAIKQLINMDHLFKQFFQIILIYLWCLSIYENIIKFHYWILFSSGNVVPKKDLIDVIQRFNIQVNNLTQVSFDWILLKFWITLSNFYIIYWREQ